MTPNSNLPAREGEETALSSPSRGTISEPVELTEPSTPADVTIVRPSPSAPVANENTSPSTASTTNSFGKYELVGEIARGGMGVVHRARQHGLDRLVALKMIRGVNAGEESAQRFMLEARAAAALDHPNVVPIYDIGEIDGHPYFTMALIDGPNLRGYVDQNGMLPIPSVVSLFAQIVMGVAHAHKHGIVHRDLKPANVLIDSDGRPRVTDFGLAKRAATDTNLTATGQVVGTPQYMAPEQARDSKEVGPPADVYALGAILYFMLTGKPPFQGDGITDLLIKVVTETPVPPRQIRADVPADLEALCLQCLAKAPRDRFTDAEALAAALAPIADQYLTPSASLTPSLANLALPRPRSMPSTPSVPDVAMLSTSTPQLLDSPSGSPSTRNRPSLIIALCVVATVLVVAIAFLATRGKKPETVKDEPAPAPHDKNLDTAKGEGSSTSGKQPTPPNDPSVKGVPMNVSSPGSSSTNPDKQPVPPKVDVVSDKFAWPAAKRADFGLKVDLFAPAVEKETDGTIRMIAGRKMTIRLKADRDCHVSVWSVDPAGVAVRLFPNDDDPDDRLKAGVERVVPNKDYTMETTPTKGAIRLFGMWVRSERLRVIATIGAQPAFPPGVKNKQFTFYASDPDREKLASAVRGVVIKKANGSEPVPSAVSEVELRFRVQK